MSTKNPPLSAAEKVARMHERAAANLARAADSMAPAAIGRAVVALHAAGKPVDVPAVLAHLLEPVQALQADHLRRLQAESAARLLGWSAAPPALP